MHKYSEGKLVEIFSKAMFKIITGGTSNQCQYWVLYLLTLYLNSQRLGVKFSKAYERLKPIIVKRLLMEGLFRWNCSQGLPLLMYIN